MQHDRVDVIATVQGGTRSSEIVADSPALLGFETSTARPPEDLAVHFCDFPFTDETASFDDHLSVVARETPSIAVAPDIEAGRNPEVVYEQASELARYADTVIIVPKSIHPGEVPEAECIRVGVPLADFGSDAPWSIPEYRDAGPLHFLGGSPRLQLETAKYLPNVKSVDTASIFKAAEVGSVFAPTGERNWHPTGDQAGYYDRVCMSLVNSVTAWEDPANAEALDYDLPYDPDLYESAEDAASDVIDSERRYRQHRGRPAVEAGTEDLWRPGEIDEHGMEVVDWIEREEEELQRQLQRLQAEASGPGEQSRLPGTGPGTDA